MGRAPCCDKTKVKRGPWSPEEDATLKAYLQTHGSAGNWIALPTKAGLKRCGKSCRLRWLNYLRPDIKHGGFTEDEDHKICNLYNQMGSRWSIIASHLPGRTDNDVKNYWNTKLKKKLLAGKITLTNTSTQTPTNNYIINNTNTTNYYYYPSPALFNKPPSNNYYAPTKLLKLEDDSSSFTNPATSSTTLQTTDNDQSSFYSPRAFMEFLEDQNYEGLVSRENSYVDRTQTGEEEFGGIPTVSTDFGFGFLPNNNYDISFSSDPHGVVAPAYNCMNSTYFCRSD